MTTPPPAAPPTNHKLFRHSILGGTFDHLHMGHKHFIDSASASSERLSIGLTSSPDLLKGKFLSHAIESYFARKTFLTAYLREKKYIRKTDIIPLNDIFGNSLTEKDIDAIFVTGGGAHNANIINTERKKRGFSELKIIKVPHIFGADGKIISSQRIRGGEIDREGNPYLKAFNKTLFLPESIRKRLKTPLGKVYKSAEGLKGSFKEKFVISVGDVSASSLGFQANISIVDFTSGRKAIANPGFMKNITDEVNNEPGTINKNAVTSLSSALKRCVESDENEVIRVHGEEDLLTLPAILLSPLGSIVFYGMYGQGLVGVNITEAKKDEIRRLLNHFNRQTATNPL